MNGIEVSENTNATVDGIDLMKVRSIVMGPGETADSAMIYRSVVTSATPKEKEIAQYVWRKLQKAQTRGYKAESIRPMVWQWIMAAVQNKPKQTRKIVDRYRVRGKQDISSRV
jgi:hypothetical protein